MKTYLFDVDFDPARLATSQQKGEQIRERMDGRQFVHHFTKRRVANAQQALAVAILGALPTAAAQRKPSAKPWRVSLVFYYAPASMTKAQEEKPRTSRPDVDNLLKTVLDVLTRLKRFWKDDAQVVWAEACKMYSTRGGKPRIEVRLTEVD